MRLVLVTEAKAGDRFVLPRGTVAATGSEAASLRSRFHVAPGTFAVVLVGKDGGEKFRATHPVSAAELTTLVDAMPMRQQEMRRR